MSDSSCSGPSAACSLPFAPRLGTLVTFPMGVWLGLSANAAAASSTIGGADGPMVLFTALVLAPEIFVPITVVGYLYLGLCYGGYPYLIRIFYPEIYSWHVDADREDAANLLEREVAFCSRDVCGAMSAFSGGSATVAVGVSGCGNSGERPDALLRSFQQYCLVWRHLLSRAAPGCLCEAETILDPTVLILLILV